MTLNDICQYLGTNLSKEAKLRLKFALDTVNLCNKPHFIFPEICIVRLTDYNELLGKRIEYLYEMKASKSMADILRFKAEIETNLKCIKEIKAYEEATTISD